MVKQLKVMVTTKVKILLANLRDYIIEEKGFNGMCVSNASMFDNKKISKAKFDLIHSYINDNKPEEHRFKGYWWGVGDKKPRIEWLNEQIEKLD
jgi:hypothetical protein